MDGKASVISRRGRPKAVVIGFEEWRRLSAAPSIAKLLMSAPLAGVDLPDRDGLEGLGRHYRLNLRAKARQKLGFDPRLTF